MIAAWPWGNTDEEPDHEAFQSYMPPDLTVFPSDYDDEPALLNAKGEPIRWVPRNPIGFTIPEP